MSCCTLKDYPEVYRGCCRIECAHTDAPIEASRRRLPDTRISVTHRVVIDYSTDLYIIVGLYPDGRPGELFLKVGKVGSTMRGLLDILGIWTSVLLQVGVPLDDLCDKMIGVSFEPNGKTDNEEILNCTSIADYVFRWLRWKFQGEGKDAEA